MTDNITEIKNALKNNTIVLGQDEVLKLLKQGMMSQIFMASNVSSAMEENITRYASIANTPATKISIANDEIKVVCKKQFLISVLGIKK